MPETALAPSPRGPSPLGMVLGVAAVGGLGYVAYRYWYLPSQLERDLRLYAAQGGQSPQDAIAKLGAVGCQVMGAKYGLPPQASSGICSELGAAASQLAREIPGLVSGTLGAVGGGVSAIGQGVASAGVAIATAPTKVVAYTLSEGYKGAKTVVSDVYSGTKTVINDVTKVPVTVVKSIASGTVSVAKKLCFFC